MERRSGNLRSLRSALRLAALMGCTIAVWTGVQHGEATTALALIGACVIISSSQMLPPWSVTLLVWSLTPFLLGRFGGAFTITRVVAGSFHPVLIVFLVGFAFAGAARRHGIDEKLTHAALRAARGNHHRLLALLAAATLWLSAWISNVAAAALMFGALRPLLRRHMINHGQQRTAILTVAIAANLGGMATPIGTGANAVALAAIRPTAHIAFVEWMIFAVPLTLAIVAVTLIAAMLFITPPPLLPLSRDGRFQQSRLDVRTASIFGATVALWLTEPWHYVPAHIVAALAAAALVTTRAIGWAEIKTLDWGALLLIAGGIGIGYVMQESGAAAALVDALPIAATQPRTALFALCLLSACLAAVMSNTGTAALLIPIASVLLPAPSTVILIALATGLGFPFSISTPANAMARQAGARQSDLLLVSIPTILLGSALLAFTGPPILGLLGIP